MMQTRPPLIAVLGMLGALMLTLPLRADDKTTLIELDLRSHALPNGVNATGSIVVGALDGGGSFYWMPTTGTIFNGGKFAAGVSRDGRTIVGTAPDVRVGIDQAAIWLRAAEWRLLGSFPNAVPCDSFLSGATGTNSDGRVVVGYARNGCTFTRAFRWTEDGGMADLGSLVAGRNTVAEAVSGDGEVVVGYQERSDGVPSGARWADGREQIIPSPADYPIGFVGSAKATNRDGTVVVGRICRFGLAIANIDDQSAWMWTPDKGTQCLPAPRRIASPGPVIIGEAEATSDDGRIVGGSQNVGGSPDSNAVIWVDGTPAYLKDFLRANGVPDAFERWINTGTITDISPDGRILVGWGAALGGFRGYIVILGSNLVMP